MLAQICWCHMMSMAHNQSIMDWWYHWTSAGLSDTWNNALISHYVVSNYQQLDRLFKGFQVKANEMWNFCTNDPMITSSNGNIFMLLAICARDSPVPGKFPAQRSVTQSFGVFFDLRLNKRLNKQYWGWWFETLSRPLWRHRYAFVRVSRAEDISMSWRHNEL